MSTGTADVRPESLAQLLGGGRAAFDATVPVVAFAAGYFSAGQSVPWGSAAAVLAALVVAVWRWRSGVRPRAVLIGVLGVCAAAAIALYTNRGEDFFLIRIVSNAASAVAWALSIALRWPLLGVVVGTVLGQKTRWRRDPALLRAYGRASWVWVAQYVLRLAAFIPLWNGGHVGELAVAQIVLSWPLVVVILALSGVALWRSLPQGHPGLRHPMLAPSLGAAPSSPLPGDSVSFPPEVLAAVLRHMNLDHADDNVLICRALGGEPEATAALMSDVDSEAAYFEATVGDRTVAVRIPFRHPLTERPQIRTEVTWMYHEACARLGVPPRAQTAQH